MEGWYSEDRNLLLLKNFGAVRYIFVANTCPPLKDVYCGYNVNSFIHYVSTLSLVDKHIILVEQYF